MCLRAIPALPLRSELLAMIRPLIVIVVLLLAAMLILRPVQKQCETKITDLEG